MILFGFYLLMLFVSYSLFIDLANTKKDQLVAVIAAVFWPLWLPAVGVFILLAIFQELG